MRSLNASKLEEQFKIRSIEDGQPKLSNLTNSPPIDQGINLPYNKKEQKIYKTNF